MHGYEIEFVFGVPLYNTTAGYTNREFLRGMEMGIGWIGADVFGTHNSFNPFIDTHHGICRRTNAESKNGKCGRIWD